MRNILAKRQNHDKDAMQLQHYGDYRIIACVRMYLFRTFSAIRETPHHLRTNSTTPRC